MTIAIPPIESFAEFEARAVAMMTPGFKLRAAFVHDITGKGPPTREWIVKNALLAGTMHLVIGEPGCGKSFLTLDMACTLALAAARGEATVEWFGRKCRPCGIVYLAGEGQDDFIIRIHAWMQEHDLPRDFRWPFLLVPVAIDLRSEAAQTADLIADINAASAIMQAEWNVPVGVTFVDTVNKSLAGGDDVKSEVIGAFLKNCKRIQDECSTAVVGVHHTPKATGSVDPRGHGSLKGDNDGQWFVTPARDGRPNQWAITRLKAGPTGARHEFRLRPREVGEDADGEAITSCVVSAMGSDPSMQLAEMHDAAADLKSRQASMTPDGRVILGPNLTIAMKALHQAIDALDTPLPFEARAPHGRKGCTMQQWLDELIRTMPGDDKSDTEFRDRCRKARDAASITLSNRSIIGVGDKWVWRTERRVLHVDRDNSDFAARNSAQSPANSAADAALSEFDQEARNF